MPILTSTAEEIERIVDVLAASIADVCVGSVAAGGA
jgi:hypothetical protein